VGDAFKAFQISDRVYWVGAIDWELRNFHGYLTSRGTTYNAYLILADKITLIDTVKASFTGEMLARITSVVDPSRIDYIVSNHAEMDHSGSLPQVVTDVRPEKVVASPKGVEALREHFHWDVPVEAVKTGERLELGSDAIRFVEARMLHWPDSMFSYLEGERVLFTNDAFGMHYASAERFADELEPTVWRYEAAKYFANILLPFSSIITKFLEKLPAHRFELGMIAPDHGPIWRREPERIVQLYAEWAAQQPTRKRGGRGAQRRRGDDPADAARGQSPQRRGDRDPRGRCPDRGIADDERPDLPDAGRRPHVSEGTQAKESRGRGLRLLRLGR
jgi:flavorubredoxin